MPFARILSGAIVKATDVLPDSEVMPGTGEVIPNFPSQPVALQEAAGWFVVDQTTNPRPPDTATTTWSSGFRVINGRPVEEWTEVTKSSKQVEEEARADKYAALDSATRAAYNRLRQIANYNAPALGSARMDTIATTLAATNGERDLRIRDTAAWIRDTFLPEWVKAVDAIQDIAEDLRVVARAVFRGDLLDADKD